MQKVNKHIYVLLVLVAVICFVSVKVHQDNESAPVTKENDVMDVFLLANNKLVIVPTTTSKQEITQKIEEIIMYMKQEVEPFEPLLSQSTILEEVKLDENTMVLSFSKLEYEKDKELQVLEALIYACTQFTQVNQIQLSVDNQVISNMPVNQTRITNTTRQFGINHIEPNQLYLHEGSSIPVYYQMKIKDKYYDVIQSVEIKNKDDYNEVMQTILKNRNVSSQLIQPLAEYKLKMTQPCEFDKGVLHLYFNTNILNKHKTIPTKVLHYLKLNLASFTNVKAMRIYVNGKTISVDGKNKVTLH